MSAALKFCGRDEELQTLIARWRLASDIRKPSPQLVVIKAERGVGKTRLALEFYRWLSEQVDRAGEAGYWPDAPTIVGKNLEVNPNPDDCNFKAPIPFLWWGLRAGDRGTENGVSGDAIATFDKYLAPHLLPLLVRSELRGKAVELAKTWADVVADVGANFLQIDTVLSLAKGVFGTVQILRGAKEHSVEAAQEIGASKSRSRAEAVLDDLELVLNPKAPHFARTPAVILIDDSQFAKDDFALRRFVARLINDALTQNWPVLILLTHWRREISANYPAEGGSIAGILRHLRGIAGQESAAVADMEAGILTEAHYAEIDLKPVPDLSEALSDSLPGLTPQQADAILERVGGNPRFLEQIAAYAKEHESLFENWETTRPLKTKGFTELMALAVDIHAVVYRRLREAPEMVQQAIAFASPQGIRFAHSLADEISLAIAGKPCREGIANAQEPFGVVTHAAQSDAHIGAFSERLFHEVALELRDEIKSIPGGGEQIEEAFREVLANRLLDSKSHKKWAKEDLALTFGVAANLFSKEVDKPAKKLALVALAKLANLEESRHSYEIAQTSAEKFAEIFAAAAELPDDIHWLEVTTCARLLAKSSKGSEAMSLLHALLARQRELTVHAKSYDFEAWTDLGHIFHSIGSALLTLGDDINAAAALDDGCDIFEAQYHRWPTPAAQRDLALGLFVRGSLRALQGDFASAQEALQSCLKIRRDLVVWQREVDTTGLPANIHLAQALHELAITLDAVGDLEREREDLVAAEVAWREAHSILRELAIEHKIPESEGCYSESLVKFAGLAMRRGNHEDAEVACREGLEICRRSAAKRNTPDIDKRLYDSLDMFGEISAQRGDHVAAEIAWGESLEMRRNHAARFGTIDKVRDLAIGLMQAGRAAMRRRDFAAAERAWQESLELFRIRVARLGTAESRRDLAVLLLHIGEGALEREEPAAASAAWLECLDVRRDIASRIKTPRARREAENVAERLAKIEER